MITFRNVIFAKAFTAGEGSALATEIATAFSVGCTEDFLSHNPGSGEPVGVSSQLAGRRVVIIDHPPTVGLVPLIEGLIEVGAEVHLRDHHADADKDGSTVARCREILGDRAVVTTRGENPACSSLVGVGEFRGDIVLADADQDGLTAALKSIGISYTELDADAAILDGPAAGKTAANLSPRGFSLVRAWGAIPAFGDRSRDAVMAQVITAFAEAVSGVEAGNADLDRLAAEYEKKVAASKLLASTATEPFTGFRLLDVPVGAQFDPPTLSAELDRGVLVSGRSVTIGPIAGKPGGFGRQVSLARTKQGELAGLDLANLVPSDWARGPEAGCISNTPFLLHLSPDRWAEFRSILEATLRKE